MALIDNLIKRFTKTDGCWVWTGRIQNGYGQLGFKENGKSRTRQAHRLVYEQLTGRVIASDMHLDHLCKNTLCVNPSHMEVVTPHENWLRASSPSRLNALKTTCKRGHEFDYIHPKRGTRHCSVCQKDRDSLRRLTLKGSVQ